MMREGVATTIAGRNFRCDYIIHINMEDNHVGLKDKFTTVLGKVDELNKTSVALSALGKVSSRSYYNFIILSEQKTTIRNIWRSD